MSGNKVDKVLKILIKKVGKNPEIIELKDSAEEKQKLIGGLIDVISYKDVLIIFNEEGKELNLKTNIVFDFEYIAGDCIIVGDDYYRGGFKSLTKEQIKYLQVDLEQISFKYDKVDKFIAKEFSEFGGI